MLSKKLQTAMNDQINLEFWSAYLYLSMSLDAESKGFKGIANWFFIQWLEEQDHARILMNYMHSVDAKVELEPIAKVPTAWKTPLDMFQTTLKHEQAVTASIHNLAAIAADEKDFAASNRLVWLVDEQVEEEQTPRDLITAFEMVAGDKVGTFMLDKELGERTYHKASALK